MLWNEIKTVNEFDIKRRFADLNLSGGGVPEKADVCIDEEFNSLLLGSS